ncbi:hypothetical protein FOL47_010253 [Perkinsus chesapeaki]|uniref:RRM domain-containing protein n=1 Tax=Perkinsus chesapeaki TaxID=330153 RepID=A0A7J6MQZ6_PERCH|nr:hypothetical protein FOL47_010253 [Perkinsus chesapeaki]
MSDTLLITGLPRATDEDEIRSIFVGAGLLHVRLDRDAETQRPTGYAFIRFPSSTMAAEALEKRRSAYNSQGWQVRMSATPDTVGIITEGACIDRSYQIYIGNLFPIIDSDKLTEVFKAKYEGVRAARVIRTPPDDQGHSDSLGYGFVAFDSSAHSYSCLEEVEAAVKKSSKDRKLVDLACIFPLPLGPSKGLVIRPVYQPGDVEDSEMGEAILQATSIHVAGVRPDSREGLRQLFSRFGKLDPDRGIFVSPRGAWARVTFVDHVNALGALSHLQGVPFNDKPLELTWHVFRRRPGEDDNADNFDSALRRSGTFGIRDTENRSAEFYESMKPQKRRRRERPQAELNQPPSAATRQEWLRKTFDMMENRMEGKEPSAEQQQTVKKPIAVIEEDDSDAVSEHPSDISDSEDPANQDVKFTGDRFWGYSSELKEYFLMIYTLYIYAPGGKVVYYEAFHRSRSVGNMHHEQRLLWGMVATMKSFGQAMSPLKAGAGPSGFNTFSTPEYKLHHCESQTGYMFILTTDPTVEDMQEVLGAIYSDFFVELVLKNPLYDRGMPIDGKSCPNFAPRLRQFLQSKHQYSSLPLAFS